MTATPETLPPVTRDGVPDFTPGSLVEALCHDLVVFTGSMGIDWFRRRTLRDAPKLIIHTASRTAGLEPSIHFNAEGLRPGKADSAHQRLHFLRHGEPARGRLLENARALATALDATHPDFRVQVDITEFENRSIHARVRFDLENLRFTPNPVKPAAARARLDTALAAIDQVARLWLPGDFSEPDRTAAYTFADCDAFVARRKVRGAAGELVKRNPEIEARSADEAWLLREIWVALMTGRALPAITADSRPDAVEEATGRFRRRVPGRRPAD